MSKKAKKSKFKVGDLVIVYGTNSGYVEAAVDDTLIIRFDDGSVGSYLDYEVNKTTEEKLLVKEAEKFEKQRIKELQTISSSDLKSLGHNIKFTDKGLEIGCRFLSYKDFDTILNRAAAYRSEMNV